MYFSLTYPNQLTPQLNSQYPGMQIHDFVIVELFAQSIIVNRYHTRFKAMTVTGNPEAGLKILDKLDNLTE